MEARKRELGHVRWRVPSPVDMQNTSYLSRFCQSRLIFLVSVTTVTYYFGSLRIYQGCTPLRVISPVISEQSMRSCQVLEISNSDIRAQVVGHELKVGESFCRSIQVSKYEEWKRVEDGRLWMISS